MNKQNKIFNKQSIIKTYKYKIPHRQLNRLESKRWISLFNNSDHARNAAYIIGKLMGDGNLDSSFTCRFVGDKNNLISLRDLIINNYSIKANSLTINSKKAKGISHILQINDSLFGRMMFCLGAPIGNKTKARFLVPNWIKESKNYSRYFLKGIFEDEFSTIKIKRERFFQEATFRMAKIEEHQDNLFQFLTEIKDLTQKFFVESSLIGKTHFESTQKDGNKTYSLCFRILGNYQNILNFHKNIGFGLNQVKTKELEDAVK